MPHLAGGGDFGVPGDNAMTDADGDNIWTITDRVPSDGYTGNYTITQRSLPGDWGCKENIAGQDCAHPENWNDRQLGEHHREHGDQHLLRPVHDGRLLRHGGRRRCP